MVNVETEIKNKKIVDIKYGNIETSNLKTTFFLYFIPKQKGNTKVEFSFKKIDNNEIIKAIPYEIEVSDTLEVSYREIEENKFFKLKDLWYDKNRKKD